MEDVKIINGQAAELAEGRAEVFQLRQELQLLRHGVAQKSPCSYSVKNTVKFNVSRKSYWDVDRVTQSLKSKKIWDYLRNTAENLPSEFKPIELRIIAKFSWVITQYDIDLSLFIPFTLSAKNLCESIWNKPFMQAI